jgi:hypothetical protein
VVVDWEKGRAVVGGDEAEIRKLIVEGTHEE